MKYDKRKLMIIAAAVIVLFVQAAEAQVLPVVCKLRGTLGIAPPRGTTGTLPNRIRRAGTPTTCSSTAVPTPFNDASGSYLYNTHTLTNPSVFPICMPIRLTKTNPSVSGADLHLAVFQQPFAPTDITNTGRFRGDSGGSTGAFAIHQPTTFNVVIPGNSSVSLLVYNTVGSSVSAEPYEIDFCTTTTNYTGSALAIPDNNPTGVNANLPISASGRVTDVNFRFTTGPNACNATVGNTNAGVDHSFVGDLNFKLSAPGGFPTAFFWERRGGTRENICSTLIDDEGSYPSLSTISNQTGQFVSGSFSPEDNQRLSRFDGQAAQGTWVLNVSDNAFDDTGTLRRFALEITTAPLKKAFDYDGDGRADLSIYRQSVGEWWYNRSSDFTTAATQFGGSDRIVPRDYTGDGITDIAIWRPPTGEWFILRSEDYSYYAFPFGITGDLPAPGDYDGDSFDDVAVFRPSTGIWYISLSTGGFIINNFGIHADMPVVADYDGDGKTDQAVFRRNGANPSGWFVRYSRNNQIVQLPFGDSSDTPVPGDYDGDGRADIAVWRPSNGTWYIVGQGSFPFGSDGDRPAPADYDGDGKYDPTVFRPNGGLWYSARSNGGIAIQQFGLSIDSPTQASAVQRYIAGW
jgi:hypothetical protein